MLDTLRSFLTELTGTPRQDRFEENDYRLAAAALLVHVTTIDGAITDVERRKLHSVIKSRFDLDDAASDELIGEATRPREKRSTSIASPACSTARLDEDGRLRIIEMMWEMIYADGHVNEFEDNVVWRVADLLGVSSRERIELRQQVSGAEGEPGRHN